MRGSVQQCAGDRNALPLAAGERLAAFADERIVAVGQVQNELVGAGGAGGGDDFGRRCVGPAVGDVLGDRAVEQERLLQHDADVAAILFDRERADVGAIDENRAVGDVVEAADEIHERALAGAAGADEADHFARFDRRGSHRE